MSPKAVMLCCAVLCYAMYIPYVTYMARNIISHPAICHLFHNTKSEGKPWDYARNLILHLAGKKKNLQSLGCQMYPICLYLKLIDDMMKAVTATLTLPMISVLKYNLMRQAPENKKSLTNLTLKYALYRNSAIDL